MLLVLEEVQDRTAPTLRHTIVLILPLGGDFGRSIISMAAASLQCWSECDLSLNLGCDCPWCSAWLEKSAWKVVMKVTEVSRFAYFTYNTACQLLECHTSLSRTSWASHVICSPRRYVDSDRHRGCIVPAQNNHPTQIQDTT